MAFVLPSILVAVTSMIAFRAVLAMDTLSSLAPKDTNYAVRLLKTPMTRQALDDRFHGILVFNDAPWTIDGILDRSHRNAIFFFNDSGISGVAFDGKLDETDKQTAEALHFTVSKTDAGTYIGREAPFDTQLRPRFSLASFMPWANGEVSVFTNGQRQSAGLRLTKDSLRIYGLGRGARLRSPLDDAGAKVAAAFSMTAGEFKTILSPDVPLVYPGIRALFAEAGAKGLSFVLGQDQAGTAFSLTIPGGSLAREDLESATSELFALDHLKTTEYEDVYTRLDEIVSSSTEKPVTTSEPGITITSLRENDGRVVRATQTNQSLIITNRETKIQGKSPTVKEKSSCLRGTNQFILPEVAGALAPQQIIVSPRTIVTMLLASNEIAFADTSTKACW
ncbi:MAG: hypothetical protein WC802_02610 [Patescibacteria group bacterium]